MTSADPQPWQRSLEHQPGLELAGFCDSTRLWSGFQTTWDLCAVERGASEWRYRGRTMLTEPGSIRFKEPGETFRTLGVRGPSSMRMLRIDAAWMESFLAPLPARGRHLGVLQLEGNPVAFACLQRLLDGLEASRSRLATESLLHEGLAALLFDVLESRRSSPPPPHHPAIRRVQAYIHAHYVEELSLRDLSAIAEVHPVYLCRLFRKHVGLSPHAYQTERRVEAAAARLRRGDSAAVVAAAVGFFDQSHLIRHFKRSYGITPSAYCRLTRARVHSTRIPRAPKKQAKRAIHDG